MSGFEKLPHKVKRVVLSKRGLPDDTKRTFISDIEITDENARFVSAVLDQFIGQIIGYRKIGSKDSKRDFIRLISVDQAQKKALVCPVIFHSRGTERQPLITEHRNKQYEIEMLDIADIESFEPGLKAEIIVEE